jgi:hypothetical protein
LCAERVPLTATPGHDHPGCDGCARRECRIRTLVGGAALSGSGSGGTDRQHHSTAQHHTTALHTLGFVITRLSAAVTAACSSAVSARGLPMFSTARAGGGCSSRVLPCMSDDVVSAANSTARRPSPGCSVNERTHSLTACSFAFERHRVSKVGCSCRARCTPLEQRCDAAWFVALRCCTDSCIAAVPLPSGITPTKVMGALLVDCGCDRHHIQHPRTAGVSVGWLYSLLYVCRSA